MNKLFFELQFSDIQFINALHQSLSFPIILKNVKKYIQSLYKWCIEFKEKQGFQVCF